MFRIARPEIDAPSALRRITRWIHLEARIVRDARRLEALPDDRLADIGIGRDGILRALRHGRGARPGGSMTPRRSGVSLPPHSHALGLSLRPRCHGPAVPAFDFIPEKGAILMPKILLALMAGLVAFTLANIVSNLLFFQLGAPILFDPEIQSAKIIDVLFEMEPRPLMFENGPLYMAYGLGVGAVHGLVFMMIEPALGQTRLQRGLQFAVVLWALMALYFEFHTPFNMFREPLMLVGLELFFWIFVVLAEGLVLSFIYGRSRHDLATAVE